MKNYILGVLTVILIQGTLNYSHYYMLDNDTKENMKIYDTYGPPIFWTLEYLKLSPVIHVLTKRCTKDLRNDKVSNREWFSCNKLQNVVSDLIYE